MRTRDEYLKGGVLKEEYKKDPKIFYRVIYVVDINNNRDLAVVRITSKKVDIYHLNQILSFVSLYM